jgi:hypothetical protein
MAGEQCDAAIEAIAAAVAAPSSPRLSFAPAWAV